MLTINSPDIIAHIKGLYYLSDYMVIRAPLGGGLLKGDHIYKSLRYLQYLHLICSLFVFSFVYVSFRFCSLLKNIFSRKNDM